jgi:hydroxymethylglutaryl-CoA reductase
MPISRESRIPGFHHLSVPERRRVLGERAGIALAELERAVTSGGLEPMTADKMVENSIGTYALPFGIALNFRINGSDQLAPMVVEEPSVIAAASNAARIVRASGGFEAETLGSSMIAQVQLYDVSDSGRAQQRILAATDELLELAARAVPSLAARGGGARGLEVRDLGDGYLVVHLHVDCVDAMGANLVNSIAEALGPRIASLAGGKLGLRILSNLCDGRRVRVRCLASSADLEVRSAPGCAPRFSGDEVISGIVRASEFAERDVYRAATHNKGIMNGIDSVVIATGNDFRAVEAGAHAYASRSGCYRPLSRWWRDRDRLVGELVLPLALGVVGGTLRLHGGARMALRLSGVGSASELALLAASVGLASNLAALRALATVGIQVGHMSLHARSVATAAGALDDEVEFVARSMSERREVTLGAAQTMLDELRAHRRDASVEMQRAERLIATAGAPRGAVAERTWQR